MNPLKQEHDNPCNKHGVGIDKIELVRDLNLVSLVYESSALLMYQDTLYSFQI